VDCAERFPFREEVQQPWSGQRRDRGQHGDQGQEHAGEVGVEAAGLQRLDRDGQNLENLHDRDRQSEAHRASPWVLWQAPGGSLDGSGSPDINPRSSPGPASGTNW